MPKRLSIQADLAVDELELRYRRAKDPVVRSHWQVIWLLAQGLPSVQVATVTSYTVNWIRTIARRYNQRGPAGLEDRRHRNPGATGLLSAAQRAALAAALAQPPPDGGVWTGPKAAAWMAAMVIVQGVVHSGDRRWQAFFSQGPVAGSPQSGVIFRSTPLCSWYTHAALTMPRRLFEDLTVCWGTRQRGGGDRP